MYDGFRLPAQEVRVEILLILIAWNMTQVGEMDRLGMDHRMKICSRGTHLVIVDGQVRVEFTGHTRKAAVRGCIELSCSAIYIHNNTGNAGRWCVDDLTQ